MEKSNFFLCFMPALFRNFDEAPECNKDIDIDMDVQKDLVDIVEKLISLAVMKEGSYLTISK